jgi:bifunctional non-homologous end joining protein LigD
MAKGNLREYGDKRSFGATPEPRPVVVERTGPLLFVVQQHAASHMHYDLRLELDGVLKSWAVPKGISLDPSEKRLAMQTEDHPFEYAAFEGVIPAKQYGAGKMIVWDCGVYSPDEPGLFFHDRETAQREARDGLANGKLGFQLRGEKLKGSFALVRTRRAGDQSWLILKHRDRHADKADITLRDRSVISGRAITEVKGPPDSAVQATSLAPSGPLVRMPEKLEPMHGESAEKPFNRDDWMWEPKLDGYRAIAFIDAGGVRLRSRRGLELSALFPRLVGELLKQSPDSMILDGEIVAFDANGRPSFNALQNRAQLKTEREIARADAEVPVVFVCFDLLHFAGVDLRQAPYRDRRRYLSQCLLCTPIVQLMHASRDGIALHDAALASGFEGIVGKRLDSRYEAGKRSRSWVKVKPVATADFVVGGYTRGKGARASLGALLVGYWEDGKLRYASHVGSGFDDSTVGEVKRALDRFKAKACPFEPTPVVNAPPTWLEPRAVAEVKFQSWTEDEHLRAPVFVRLRDDIDPKRIRREAARRDELADIVAQLDAAKSEVSLAIGEHRVKLTNLDRVYWPENKRLKQPALTKRDLIRYLAQVSRFMLPHLADRPLTMIRMPDGIRGERFFQKHWAQARPGFVEGVTVFSGHKDEEHEYLLCNNLATLLWLAQSGTLEFHIWHSRARTGPDAVSKSTDYASSLESLEGSVLNYPDYVLFDIDPYIYSGKEAKGAEPELNTVAFEKGKEVAFWLRELLHTMKLGAIVKTSGKTGLHIFVPIRRRLDFDAARHVSELVGRHLMTLHPEDITLDWSIPKRTGKIFMDYNMNVRGKTLNVAYSPRGESGAPVSMPLTWDELANAHPLDFRMTNAIERLERTGDRWSDALERKQDLERALKSARA